MLDSEYFLDSDKMYYKNKDYIYTYTDADDKDKSNEILLNDTSINKFMTLNSNLTVLRNKLHKKLDRSKNFKDTDIEYGPLGFVLVSPGDGMRPYWESPTNVMSSLKTNELIDKEYFIIDSSTIDSSLFTNLSNVVVGSNIQFTADGYIYLKPFEITNTGNYQVYMEVTPKKLQLLKTQAGTVYVRDLNIDTDYTYVCVTDRGNIILDVTNITSDNTGSKLYTNTVFSSVISVFAFKLKLDVDIFDSARNFKTQNIDDILIVGDKLYIDYAEIDCSGNQLEFVINAGIGTTIDRIKITLNVTEEL